MNQVDEDSALPEDLRLVDWLLYRLDRLNITVTEKEWKDYNRNVLGDEFFEEE